MIYSFVLPIVAGQINVQQMFTGLYDFRHAGAQQRRHASYAKLAEQIFVQFWRELISHAGVISDKKLLRFHDLAAITSLLRCEHVSTGEFDHEHCESCITR